MVEGARLESVYTFIAYRGFESPSVRQELDLKTRPAHRSAGFLLSVGFETGPSLASTGLKGGGAGRWECPSV